MVSLDFTTRKATPKKARKFKKIASPSQKLTTVLEEEPAQKPKRTKKHEPAKQAETAKKTAHAKKSSTMQTLVLSSDTPAVFVSKKKAQAKVDRGKGMDLLSDVALLEAAQLKKVLKKSKQDTHMLHASGLNNGLGSKPKVLDELEEKKTGINEGTGTIRGVPDVPKYQSESENESCGDSGDDDDDNDSNNDDNDNDSDDNGNNEQSDDDHKQANDERTESDDEEEEKQDDEYVHTPDYYVPTNEETVTTMT
ncbi:hypothetical protein Tco_1097266 [Tanacetum coccineum]